MRHALFMLLTLAACTRQTAEERKKKYTETLETELKAAQSSYALFAALKQGIGADVRACESKDLAQRRAFRLSMAHLELLNGAPHKDGVLVVDLPAPDGFDNLRGFPPRLVEPRDLSDDELAKLVKDLRAAHAAMANADGFYVQRVDAYVPPALRAQGFQPGSVTGRVFAFDGQGQPQCFLSYEASGASDAGVDLAEKELRLSLRRAFQEHLRLPVD
ncbi:MAG: hypothetical protein JNM17_21290 [Archangium sp.]|nr:hypothetical protein [Archangium sp.]